MAGPIRIAERAFLLLLSLAAVLRLAGAVPYHPQMALFLFSEVLGVALLLLQRRGEWTSEPRPVLIAFTGTGAALLVAPGGTALLSDSVSTALIFAGAGIALAAKLCIGRSFGVIPANRGVKRGGVYRVVRHPMYFGYMLNHVGLLLLYPSAWNLAVYAVAWTA
ncbi:MAG: methyltransferase, partial [Novosphingobium sp.]